MEQKIKSRAGIDFTILLILSEDEARALYNMTIYGPDEFVKWFYTHMGKHYLKPHEQGLRSLFETIQKELSPHLSKADEARKIFELKPNP